MVKRILVLGANGQLGRSLRDRRAEFQNSEVRFYTREQVDLTIPEQLTEVFADLSGDDILINCAACTDVEGIERNPQTTSVSKAVNVEAPGILAKLVARAGAWLVHIGTDYVFSDRRTTPWRETDDCQPLNRYGRHKREGELAIEAEPAAALIIRTSALYSEYGDNFVKTILRLGAQSEEIQVVYDEIIAPTYAGDLSRALVKIVNQLSTSQPGSCFYYQYCNEGAVSRYDFAWAILKLAGSDCRIQPTVRARYSSAVCRSSYSVMSNWKIKSRFDLTIPYWRDSLDICLKNLA